MSVSARIVLAQLVLRISPVTKGQQTITDGTVTLTVSATATSGGLIKVTCSSAHGLKTGDQVFISGVTGTVEANNTLANPAWTITYVSTTAFTLDGSTFTNAWASGGTVYPALVGAVDADGFTREQYLSLLNQARWGLMGTVVSAWKAKKILDPEKLLPGWIVTTTTLQFTSGSASKPAGYVETLKLTDASGTRIPVYTPTEYERVINKLSVNNPAVEDMGTVLLDESAGTNVPNASTYILKYFGLTDFQIGDILNLSGYTQTTEPLDEEMHEVLYRGAIAISKGMGGQDVSALFARELGLL